MTDCGCENCTCHGGRVLVNYVLDESGSMQSVRQAAIDGYNEYLQEIRKEEKEVLFSLTKFASDIRPVHTLEKLENVAELNADTYIPDTMTALYDAIGQTVRNIEKSVRDNDKVLVVIMTDGMENQSREYTQETIKSLITEKEALGNWTFVYLGANQDAFAIGGGIGIQAGNTLNYQATSHGHSTAMRSVASATTLYAAQGGQSTASFFAEGEEDTDAAN